MISLLLALIYLCFISLGLPDSLLGSAWPVMQIELGAPVSYAGIISTIILLGTILSSLMSNFLTSKFGPGKITAISVATTAIALLGFSLSTKFWMLALWAIPYGLGAGGVDATLNNYVALHFKSRHMSWLHCMWGLGAVISPYVMSYAVTSLNSWNTGYRIISFIQIFLSIIVFISLPLWKKGSASSACEKAETPKNFALKDVLKTKGAIACFVTFFCYCGIENLTMLWASSYLVSIKNVTPEIATGYASLFFIGITVGRAINGFLTIKWSDKFLIRLGEMIILAGIILVALPFDLTYTIIGFITIGVGCAPIYPSIIHMTPTLFGEDKSQAMIGVQMACAYTGSCVTPLVFGVIADSFTFYALPIFMFILLGATITMHEIVVKKTALNNQL